MKEVELVELIRNLSDLEKSILFDMMQVIVQKQNKKAE